MHNLFNATIKIPCRIEKNGTITPFQERYTIEFDRIYELPQINTTEYAEMITQLFDPIPETESSAETSPDSSQENYPDSSDEALAEKDIAKPKRKPSLNISFKRRKNKSSHNFSVKRQASPIN